MDTQDLPCITGAKMDAFVGATDLPASTRPKGQDASVNTDDQILGVEDELLYFLSKDLEVAVKAVDSPDQILTELMLMAKKS